MDKKGDDSGEPFDYELSLAIDRATVLVEQATDPKVRFCAEEIRRILVRFIPRRRGWYQMKKDG